MSSAMTKAEREAFLADVHVAVVSIPEAGRGPLTVPVWYGYDVGARCGSGPVEPRARSGSSGRLSASACVSSRRRHPINTSASRVRLCR